MIYVFLENSRKFFFFFEQLVSLLHLKLHGKFKRQWIVSKRSKWTNDMPSTIPFQYIYEMAIGWQWVIFIWTLSNIESIMCSLKIPLVLNSIIIEPYLSVRLTHIRQLLSKLNHKIDLNVKTDVICAATCICTFLFYVMFFFLSRNRIANFIQNSYKIHTNFIGWIASFMLISSH